uniref:Stromal interaction molecule homolog n=1 Tax=Cacopsylla melanoneura TaxID=428564 RepID=A0A8D8PS11_9HEMI
MKYFQATQLTIGLFFILIYVCNGSVKESGVPVIVSPKDTNKPQDVPRSNLERKTSNIKLEHVSTLAPPESMSGESCHDDLACLSMASHDRLGLDAIRTLHRQLDDDANGVIELSESDEFLREELKYDDGAEKRQKAFHKNDDMHVSVKELWDVWIKSEVHNWTVEQTADWLATSVELPQYVPIFIMNRVTGAQLPRLAVSNMHFLNNVLGVKDPIHKQKITLKAMDVVLFGPPKDSTSHVKDYILGTLILVALTICWYVYRQKESSQEHLRRMMKDMEGLQRAELDLANLQKELERARIEQETAASEKIKLERKLQEHQALQSETGDLKNSATFSDLEVCQLKEEIELLRNELLRAEGELEDRCWAPPPGLQHWLQLTHEIENKAYVKKKVMAEKQLQQAREACEKLRKKRSSLVGAFVSTHGKSIDDVDRSIVEARTSLNEVTHELAERVHRWKQIELMLGFNIINNSGLAYLENMLYRNTPNGRNLLKSRMNSQDDLDDDTNSNYSLPILSSVSGKQHLLEDGDSHSQGYNSDAQ